MAGVAFAVEGDGVGFATESYAASALYTTLASLSGALWRIRRVRAGINRAERLARNIGMVRIPAGTFRMGSNNHYPEEAPVHRVSVDAFWIDRTPVTNRQFRRFVNDTGYVTFAEIKPEAKDYPGALQHMLKAGSLVFTPPKHPVNLSEWG